MAVDAPLVFGAVVAIEASALRRYPEVLSSFCNASDEVTAESVLFVRISAIETEFAAVWRIDVQSKRLSRDPEQTVAVAKDFLDDSAGKPFLFARLRQQANALSSLRVKQQ